MKKSDKFIAVIIPTLNEERFISDCLNSVLSQTYPIDRLDIMVVDGGSSDKTADIVQSFTAKYSNIRFLRNTKKIQSAAFNIGFNNTSASVIIRLDAHALYAPSYIERCVNAIENDPQIGNVGGICNILPFTDSIVAEANALLNSSRFGIGGATFRVGGKAGYVDTVPFGAFPRRTVEELGGMREDLARGEDNEYNYRIRSAGYKIFFDPEIVSTYYSRPTLLSSMKQMFANGLSIAQLFYLEKQIISIRHLVPLAFFLTLAILVGMSFVINEFLVLLIGLLLIYLIAALVSAAIICNKHGWRYFAILPIMFFLIHISYGYGTFVGLLKFSTRK